MKSQDKKIAIIGAGASGTILANQLIEKIAARKNIKASVILIEKSGEFGPGLAYSTSLSSHILNMRAGTMSARIDNEAHFVKWMKQNISAIKNKFPDFDLKDSEYPPRKIYGLYLKDILGKSIEKAGKNSIPVELVKGKALDITHRGDVMEITLEDGKNINADYTILAPGNFPPTFLKEFNEQPGYIPYPWPASGVMEKIPADASVCIIGSGLSAIDTLFTLIENKHNEKITFLSRSGFFPKVQGIPSDYVLKFIRIDKIRKILKEKDREYIPLDLLVNIFFQEIEEAEGKTVDRFQLYNPEKSATEILEADIEKAKNNVLPYQSVLNATDTVIGRIWNLLSVEDRRRFDLEFRTLWNVYRHPMPLKNAVKILNSLKSGQLNTKAGYTYIRPLEKERGYEININTRFGIPYSFKAHFIINAAGQGLDVTEFNDPLINNLLDKGLIQSHPNGGIAVEFISGQVIERKGDKVPRLFALGELTRGVRFYTSGITPNMVTSDGIADYILNDILFTDSKKLQKASV